MTQPVFESLLVDYIWMLPLFSENVLKRLKRSRIDAIIFNCGPLT